MLGVAFILVSVPLFYQVRADAAESKETANNTFLSKVFRDLAKDLKKNPPKDLQVEDAWQKWQQENPDCGAECDPDADPDGDNLTNREEIDQKRNPNCNEEKEGVEYCEGQPKTPPPQNQTVALDDLLFEEPSAGQGFSERFDVGRVRPEYDRWVVTWILTGYQGVSSNYRVAIYDSEDQAVCCPSKSVDLLSDSDSDSETLDGEDLPPSGAEYRVAVESQGAVSGTWHIKIRGVRDAPAEPAA